MSRAALRERNGLVQDGVRREDHIVFLDGVSWQDYERLLEVRGDRSAPRMTYLEGTLQIMSPSYDHERIKSVIGCLVEAYCLDREIDFSPVGSWTIKEQRVKRGAEPDECYVFGVERKERPDLAIEVVWTHGGLDKLDVYRKLGVREVWVWEEGTLSVFALRGQTYRRRARSLRLPDLDLELLASFVGRSPVSRAVRDFRRALARRARA